MPVQFAYNDVPIPRASSSHEKSDAGALADYLLQSLTPNDDHTEC